MCKMSAVDYSRGESSLELLSLLWLPRQNDQAMTSIPLGVTDKMSDYEKGAGSNALIDFFFL